MQTKVKVSEPEASNYGPVCSSQYEPQQPDGRRVEAEPIRPSGRRRWERRVIDRASGQTDKGGVVDGRPETTSWVRIKDKHILTKLGSPVR